VNSKHYPSSCGCPRSPTRRSRSLPVGRLLPANPVNHTPKRPIAVFSSSWIFVSEGRGSASGRDLGGSTAEGQSPNEVRFCLSHFPSPRTSCSRPIGQRAAPTPCCGDAQFVNAIRSSAMDAAASRRTMSITIGSASGVVAALGVERHSHFSHCFLCRTRTTAC